MNIENIEKKKEEALDQANAMIIRDNGSYENAAGFLLSLKAIQKDISLAFDPIIEKAYEAHKEAKAQKDRYLEPVVGAETLVKSKMLVFQANEEKKRRQEEMLAREAALKAEEDRRLEEAAKISKEGRTKEAEELLNEPIKAPVVIVPKTISKVQGIYTQKIWKYRITNADKIPRNLMVINEVKIGQLVRAMRNETNIPGIEAYCEEIIKAG